jgi:hypothetical protein
MAMRMPAMLVALAVSVVACSSTTTPAGESEAGLLQIRRIESTATQSLPARVTLQVSGILPDSCTQLGDVSQRRDGADVTVTITTNRRGTICAQVASVVSVQVTLDGAFASGDYVAHVNSTDYRFKI